MRFLSLTATHFPNFHGNARRGVYFPRHSWSRHTEVNASAPKVYLYFVYGPYICVKFMATAVVHLLLSLSHIHSEQVEGEREIELFSFARISFRLPSPTRYQRKRRR